MSSVREPRALGTAAALVAAALPGALPGERGAPDAIALLAWLAFVAPAAGVLAGAARTLPALLAAAVPAAWIALLAGVDAAGARELTTPLSAGLAAAGLYATGWAFGRVLAPERRVAAAAALVALAALLVLLPLAGAWLATPWPGRATGVLLDLSPLTLLAECAGVDWLRHPAVYDAAGVADLDPRWRAPYRPALAAGIALVVGCVLALLAARIDRRHAAAR